MDICFKVRCFDQKCHDIGPHYQSVSSTFEWFWLIRQDLFEQHLLRGKTRTHLTYKFDLDRLLLNFLSRLSMPWQVACRLWSFHGPGPVCPVVQVRVQSRSAPGPGHIPVPGPKGPKGSIGKTHPELFGICSGKIWFYTNIQDFIFVVDVLLALSKHNDAAFGPCFA